MSATAALRPGPPSDPAGGDAGAGEYRPVHPLRPRGDDRDAAHGPYPHRAGQGRRASAAWCWSTPCATRMIPVVTVMALSFGGLFSGALITETMFAQPGMGKMIYDAILGNDFNLALTGLLFATLVTLLEQPAGRPRLWLARSADHAVSRERARLALGAALAAVPPPSHRHGQPDRPCAAGGVCRFGGSRRRIGCGVDPYETDLLSQYAPPSAAHPLGTDDAGRDELVRLMLGGQISLLVGVLSTLVGSVIGLTDRRHLRLFRQAPGRGADALHRRHDRAAAAAAADRARRARPDETRVFGGVRAFRRGRFLAGRGHRGAGGLDRHGAADPRRNAGAARAGLCACGAGQRRQRRPTS